ncbi:MAG: hypothetical protein ACLFVF_08365 [Thiohalospira sp.]
MSRTASKLTSSVRQARDSRNAGPDEGSPESPAAAETANEAAAPEAPEPQPATASTSAGEPREERPLPRMPSRRVWPD